MLTPFVRNQDTLAGPRGAAGPDDTTTTTTTTNDNNDNNDDNHNSDNDTLINMFNISVVTTNVNKFDTLIKPRRALRTPFGDHPLNLERCRED